MQSVVRCLMTRGYLLLGLVLICGSFDWHPVAIGVSVALVVAVVVISVVLQARLRRSQRRLAESVQELAEAKEAESQAHQRYDEAKAHNTAAWLRYYESLGLGKQPPGEA